MGSVSVGAVSVRQVTPGQVAACLVALRALCVCVVTSAAKSLAHRALDVQAALGLHFVDAAAHWRERNAPPHAAMRMSAPHVAPRVVHAAVRATP